MTPSQLYHEYSPPSLQPVELLDKKMALDNHTVPSHVVIPLLLGKASD
jgi:hypothetical protein